MYHTVLELYNSCYFPNEVSSGPHRGTGRAQADFETSLRTQTKFWTLYLLSLPMVALWTPSSGWCSGHRAPVRMEILQWVQRGEEEGGLADEALCCMSRSAERGRGLTESEK